VALGVFGVAVAASLAVTFALSVSAQTPAPAVMSREQLQKLLDESGTVMTNLATARTQEVPKAISDQRDKRKTGIQDDLQKNVMPPETEARLKAMRESAAKDLAAGDLPGVQVTLANLRRGLTAEIERYQAIVAYWRDIGARDLPNGVVDEALLRAHRVEPALNKEQADLHTQFDKQVAARDFVGAMGKTWPTYQELLRRKAAEESRRIVSSIDSGGFTDLRGTNPSRACVPAGTTSGDETPVPRADFPRTLDYFPAKLKALGINKGMLEVFVVVNAQGCAERAVLVKKAEYPEFDEAGLALAVDGHYLPAQKPGSVAKSAPAANGAVTSNSGQAVTNASAASASPTASEGVRAGMFLRVEFDNGL
jgi:hypothetical protein